MKRGTVSKGDIVRDRAGVAMRVESVEARADYARLTITEIVTGCPGWRYAAEVELVSKGGDRHGKEDEAQAAPAAKTDGRVLMPSLIDEVLKDPRAVRWLLSGEHPEHRMHRIVEYAARDVSDEVVLVCDCGTMLNVSCAAVLAARNHVGPATSPMCGWVFRLPEAWRGRRHIALDHGEMVFASRKLAEWHRDDRIRSGHQPPSNRRLEAVMIGGLDFIELGWRRDPEAGAWIVPGRLGPVYVATVGCSADGLELGWRSDPEAGWLDKPTAVRDPGASEAEKQAIVASFEQAFGPGVPEPIDRAWPVPFGVDKELYAENRMHRRRKLEASGQPAELPPGWTRDDKKEAKLAWRGVVDEARARMEATIRRPEPAPLEKCLAAAQKRIAELESQVARPVTYEPVYQKMVLTKEQLEASKTPPGAFITGERALAQAWREEEMAQPSTVAKVAGLAPKRRARPYHEAVIYCQNEED